MAEKHQKPAEHMEIRNCRFERGHGSVTVGSEVSGGISDVHIAQCIFD